MVEILAQATEDRDRFLISAQIGPAQAIGCQPAEVRGGRDESHLFAHVCRRHRRRYTSRGAAVNDDAIVLRIRGRRGLCVGKGCADDGHGEADEGSAKVVMAMFIYSWLGGGVEFAGIAAWSWIIKTAPLAGMPFVERGSRSRTKGTASAAACSAILYLLVISPAIALSLGIHDLPITRIIGAH